MKQERPNIILINCDDLGYGDLGCYGSKVNRTPVIDRLAEEGLRFTDFYMASPVCSPSRGGMLTGCYPPRIGFGKFEGEWVLFPGHGVGLNPAERTIARELKEQGYRTKLVGKWHCGDQKEFLPCSHGFDEYYGLPYSNDMGIQRGGTLNIPLPLVKNVEVVEEQPDQRSITERYVEHATGFIRENRERPFFLYMAHMHVHLPLYTAARFVEESQNGDYGACVEAVDWATGCIVRELERQGLREKTLVIFTSDNGSRGDHGGSNGELRGRKGTTWEGGQRVPFIVNWPGHVRRGECGELVASMDLYPTLSKLCGGKGESGKRMDGLDIGPLLFDEGESSPRKTFFYYIMNNLEAVRHGDWKLHVYKTDREVSELYNLREDAGETRNLYGEHPEIVERLLGLLEECRRDLGDELTGTVGQNVRPIGRVDNPRPLTVFDPNHPYLIAEYDREEIG